MAMNEPSRRSHILRAASRLLQRYGPLKTTMADVAREADVSVGSVYLEFESKDALIEELSAARYRVVLDAMRAAAEVPSRPFRERLRAMLDARVEAFLSLAEEGAHACDLFHCKSGPVQVAYANFHAHEHVMLVDLIRDGVRAGELEAPSPEATAYAVLSAYMSFSPPWIFEFSREALMGRLRAMHELVLYGLVRRSPVET
jgi:AcrR family transcriptional regulator